MENIPPTWEAVPADELARNADDVEESHFRLLYNLVLNDFREKIGISNDEIRNAITFIIESFYKEEGRQFSDIDFNREAMCLGYIFRYAPSGAGLARCRILEVLENCTELKLILNKNQLNVASLGCGPGNDAIAFCSAMSRSKFTGTLEITLVDSIKKWSDYIRVAQEFLRRDDYGDASYLFRLKKVKLYFCQHAMQEQFNYQKFDVVLICRLISIMGSEEIEKFIQNLYSTIKESAFILLIDTQFWKFLKFWFDKFDVLYVSNTNQPYEMRTSMQRFGHHDRVKSYARIAILRKKSACLS